MRAREFIRENVSVGATGVGSVAVVSQPLMTTIQRRNDTVPGKYKNSVVSVQPKKNKHVNK